MKRREALKKIGLSAGYIAVTPTLISILQSCNKEVILTWTPELLSLDQGKALDQIVGLILPETADIPGAKKLNVPMFIDMYINAMVAPDDIKLFTHGAEVVLQELGVGETKSVDSVTIVEYDAVLAKYLKASKEKQIEYRKQMNDNRSAEHLKSISQETIVFNYLTTVRDLAIYGFKTSEHIGEKVMAYLPVPGEQTGCDTTKKLTGGKAWSL